MTLGYGGLKVFEIIFNELAYCLLYKSLGAFFAHF